MIECRSLIFSVIIVVGILTKTLIAEREPCSRKFDNLKGACETVEKCPKIVADFRFEGIRLQPCSKDSSNQKLYCCPEKYLPKSPDTINRVDVLPTDKRISTIKCKEYAEFALKKQGVTPLLINPSVVEFSIPQCDNTIPLVVGGSPAKNGEFPHMVALGWTQRDKKINYNCGGSIISERFVLTAAHCAYIESKNPDIVFVGDVKLKSNNNNVERITYIVSEVIRHPSYHSSSKYNDIALVKVQQDMRFTATMRPACLWIPTEIEAEKCIAVGWGTTEFAGDSSNDLLKVSLDIFDQRECVKTFADREINKLKNGIIDSQICAGVAAGGKDTCQGDSGGPLQISSNQNKCSAYLIGITSFGSGCGAPGEPGVYTRVSSYVDWIESIVWPDNN